MNRLRKKSFWLSALVLVASIFGLVAVAIKFDTVSSLTPKSEPVAANFTVRPRATDIEGIMNATTFSDLGLYLCRPENVNKNNIYRKSISMKTLIEKNHKPNFRPQLEALIKRNDRWYVLQTCTVDENGEWQSVYHEKDKDTADFRIAPEEDKTNYSVFWYLREDAPAAVYAVRCTYDETYGSGSEAYTLQERATFQILYTQKFTFINITDENGARIIKNYVGGKDLTKFLTVTFNSGASDPDLRNGNRVNNNLVGGALRQGNIVDTESMNVSVKTLSGKVYENWKKEPMGENIMAMSFTEPLKNDIYIVQFSSNANGKILGQFIIDNTSLSGGVNLSHLWVVLMIFGGVLVLAGTMAFFVPYAIVKINVYRVERENKRVARMKNPEAYAQEKKGPLLQRLKEKIKYLMTPVYKRPKKEETNQENVEGQEHVGRFTKMVRERQEKRNFMREYGITSSEVEEMQRQQEEAAKDEQRSFAGLRDEGDDIATLHEVEDDLPTIETGSYVQDGVTFAKLDSEKDSDNDDTNPKN